MQKVLIVGSGLTSAITAFLLQRLNRALFQLTVWDKARGEGGRMATSRSPLNSMCSVDLGAQYITQNEKVHAEYYNDLLNAGVLEPLKANVNNNKHQDGTKHFVSPLGINMLVKYFSAKAECQLKFNHHVSEVSQKNGQWIVSTLAGQSETFDIVVLTMPTPQVLTLKGTVTKILEENQQVKRKLEAVRYSARYALGLFYDAKTELNLPYEMSYLNDDPIFRFVAVDNIKRNRPDLPTSVVLHTSVPFGVEHAEKSIQDVEPILLQALKVSFPDLPLPKTVKCHKWKYSQVLEPYEGQPGVLQLSQNPLLLVGGDGFTHSNFDGCVSSAERIAEALEKNLVG